MLFFELQADRIVPRVGELGEPIRQAQHEQHDGIAADGNAGLAFFDLDQRRPADGCPRGGDFCWNAPPAARITYIVAELAQGARDGYREHPRWFLGSHN